METWAGLAILHQEVDYVTTRPISAEWSQNGLAYARLSAVPDPL